ncbi:hypothetical protein FG87_34730 [Nocardia vulneris]|uniref:Replication-relaxation n=1 Tax=Nocardia vulneris TaxID=1141657 RepID=A0ABR4Z666_9NOCA|nr:hypothetical protein FG87_34730 [Nocardia vulneris]
MIGDSLRQKDLRQVEHAGTPAGASVGVLVARLTDRDRWLLRMLYEHRVLTSEHIAALAFPAIGLARRRLRELYRYGVIDRFRPLRAIGSFPYHYILAPAGARVIAAEEGIEPAALRWRHRDAIAIAVGLQLAHAVGVGDWFTSLAEHTRHHDDYSTLHAWWSQTRCARLWGDLVRPDAYGRFSAHHTSIEFFLEYDLATENHSQLTRKLPGYAKLAAATTITTPLLIWFPTHQRETNARTTLFDAWQDLPAPDTVPIATAAADLLDPTGAHTSPADRVWLPLHDTTGHDRARLHELPSRWPPASTTAPGSSDQVDIDAEDPVQPGATIIAAPSPVPPPNPWLAGS